MSEMLEINGLSKSYHGRQVLAPVRFVLPAGQCIGVVGENGSGKSTLLRLVAQIEKSDTGDIRFGGKSVLGDKLFMRECVGYVPQDNDLMPELTVQQQLKLWQSACGLSGPIPGELMDLMDLQPLLKWLPSELSGGMQRRVSIAMALMNNPKFLIMDEATTGLDKDYTARLLLWLEDYLAKGGRMLWCSHHRQELDRLCGGYLTLMPPEKRTVIPEVIPGIEKRKETIL